jgi:PleD family two-component response regulator
MVREGAATMLRAYSDAHVLIVDDYSDTALLVQRLLTRNGIRDVEVVIDPRMVMGHLPEFAPDLVLLDLYMPYVDGYAVLRHIREWAADSYLPVIVLTSDVRPETLLRAMADGATDFLTKPFNATEILIRVRNLLETRSLAVALREREHAHSAQTRP